MPASALVQPGSPKYALYQEICEQLHHLLGGEKSFIANAANTSALLFRMLPEINWIGFYIAEGNELVLGPFQGKPATPRIAFGKGVCGTAVTRGRTVTVPDVRKFPGHIACDPSSQSEIVVPLLNWGRLLGVLDVDSAKLKRFDAEDQEGLESVAAVFLASLTDNDLPDLSDDAAAAI
jgi:L-methionine (R)-S-oxide reductase